MSDIDISVDSLSSCFVPWSFESLQKAKGRLSKLLKVELTI